MSCFRGEAAPASLKPLAGLIGPPLELCCFRGEAAPASLKRAGSAVGGHTWTEFPGRSCPGLIEAVPPGGGAVP